MKGICFVEEMFNAVVDGEKTQTRRISKSDKPRYKKGDIIYLKEPYFFNPETGNCYYKYKSDDTKYPFANKLFMPESMARYYIKITDVKRERLQDITSEDCAKEGIPCGNIGMYAALIDKINGKGTWGRNPEVWVYDFELCIEK